MSELIKALKDLQQNLKHINEVSRSTDARNVSALTYHDAVALALDLDAAIITVVETQQDIIEKLQTEVAILKGKS